MEVLTLEAASMRIEKTLAAYGYKVERVGELAIEVATRKYPSLTRTLVRVRKIGQLELEQVGGDVIPRLQEHIRDAFADLKVQAASGEAIDVEFVDVTERKGRRALVGGR